MALARWQATITDDKGNVIANPQVTVRAEIAGSPLARLYSDRAGTVPAANPITGDSNGYVYFHVTGGAYRIAATKGGFSREWRYVGIGRNSESDLAGLRPQGAWNAEISYSGSDYIRHNERTFVSLVDENLGNEPPDAPSDNAFWMWVPLGENAELAIVAREAAEAQAGYAEEWAQSPAPISVPAGGDGSTDKSAKTWAGESAAAATDSEASATISAGLASAFIIAENTFATKATAEAWAPAAGPDYIRTSGYAAPGDGGGAIYKKVVAEPSHAGKLSITIADGVTSIWYELSERPVKPEMFGAVGDGVADDTAALRACSAYIAAIGGGAVELRSGATYIGGLQTSGGSAYLAGQSLLYASNVPFFAVRGNGATVKFKPGMKFGSFDPATGLPKGSVSVLTSERADIGRAVSATNVGVFECSDLIVDGSSDAAVLGGQWGDTGRQCIHYGVTADSCEKTVLRNLRIFNSCLDGISYSYPSLTSRNDVKPLLVENVKVDSVGRNCFSLIGTNRAIFQNCQFSNANGAPNTASGLFGSAPGSCLDIEAESGAYCQDIRISACKFIAGATTLTSIVADSGTSRDILIEDSLMVGNLWLRKPRTRVIRSEIRGKLSALYAGASDANDNIEFSDCLISDDVSAYTGVPMPTGLLIDTGGSGAGLKLNRVAIRLSTTRLNLRNAIVRYCSIAFGTGVSHIVNQDYAILATGAEWERVDIIDTISPANYPANAFFVERPTNARDCTLTSASSKIRWNSWSTGAGGYEGDISTRELQGKNLAISKGLRTDFYSGKLRIFANTAAPTTGTWQRGDYVFNENPSASGVAGWVCVAAGTPGTWKSFGAISP